MGIRQMYVVGDVGSVRVKIEVDVDAKSARVVVGDYVSVSPFQARAIAVLIAHAADMCDRPDVQSGAFL